MKKSVIVIWVIVGLLVVAGAAVISYNMGKNAQDKPNIIEPSATPIVTATSVPSVTSSAAPKATATSAPTADFKGLLRVSGILYNSDKDSYVITGLEQFDSGKSYESGAIIYTDGDVKAVELTSTDKVTDFNGDKVTIKSFWNDDYLNTEGAFASYGGMIIFDATSRSFTINE